jgi:acyl-coenzyme A thioesterase PaaI-like protein
MHQSSADVDGLPAISAEDSDQTEDAQSSEEDEEQHFDEPITVGETEWVGSYMRMRAPKAMEMMPPRKIVHGTAIYGWK